MTVFYKNINWSSILTGSWDERYKHKKSKAESNSNSLAISRVWMPVTSTEVGK